MKNLRKALAAAALLVVSAESHADGSGVISYMHWSYWDQDQSATVCFEVGNVWLAFTSNGTDKAKAALALLASSFESGRQITYSSGSTALSPAPCQSWDISGSVYQVTAISFQ